MIRNTVELYSPTTIKTLFEKCRTLNQIKQLHAHLIKSDLPENPIVTGALLSVTTTANDPSFFSYARLIFKHIRFRNTFMYNTMIRGYLVTDNQVYAVSCYNEMLKFGLSPNNFTFPPLIKSCDSKLVGCSVHGCVVKLGFDDDRFIGSALVDFYSMNFEIGNARKVFDEMPVKDIVLWTTLIDGYGKNEDLQSARTLFDEMPQRSVISWSAIMAAYSRVGDFYEVISLFTMMQEIGLNPNESILVTVLTACANLGSLAQGLWVHSYAKRRNFLSNPILATALVDMYSKCGHTNLALSVFNTISVKDTGAWNAIISGFAMNGEPRKSLELLNQMGKINIQPSATTFVALLTACTHSKLVKEGVDLFDKMDKLYGVKPQCEHYACMVDLFARAGMLEEAMEFVEKKMGGVSKGDVNVWGALLGACRVYGNVEIGNKIWRKLVEMKVNDYGIYVLCYNMFKECGWKKEAEDVRNMISEYGNKKTPGCSVVEVDGVANEFISGDFSHYRAIEIRNTLNYLFNVARLVELMHLN